MYADPDRKLYHSLSMMESLKATPAGEKKKSYLDMSLFGLVTNGFKVRPRALFSSLQFSFHGDVFSHVVVVLWKHYSAVSVILPISANKEICLSSVGNSSLGQEIHARTRRG